MSSIVVCSISGHIVAKVPVEGNSISCQEVLSLLYLQHDSSMRIFDGSSGYLLLPESRIPCGSMVIIASYVVEEIHVYSELGNLIAQVPVKNKTKTCQEVLEFVCKQEDFKQSTMGIFDARSGDLIEPNRRLCSGANVIIVSKKGTEYMHKEKNQVVEEEKVQPPPEVDKYLSAYIGKNQALKDTIEDFMMNMTLFSKQCNTRTSI